MALSLIVHCIGLLGQPIFEDDFFRYLWDGYTFANYGNPYGITPESFFLNDSLNEKFQDIIGYINHPNLPTIYGPTLQYSFLIGYWLTPGDVFGLQLIYAIANLALIRLCLTFSPPKYVLLYALSPLVFKEVLLTAHTDILGIIFLMAAVWAYRQRYAYRVGVFLGLSIGAKVFAVLLVPFLLLHKPIKVSISLLVVLSALYYPFIFDNGTSDLLGLIHMAKDWEFNSAIWGILVSHVSVETARLISAAILFVVLGSYGLYYLLQYCKGEQLLPRGDIILGLFLLCAPVINPWYLLWILPFAVITPTVTAWFASFVVFLAYIVPTYWPTLEIAGNYDQPLTIRMIEFGLIGVCFIGECLWHRYAKQTSNRAVTRHYQQHESQSQFRG